MLLFLLQPRQQCSQSANLKRTFHFLEFVNISVQTVLCTLFRYELEAIHNGHAVHV